MNSPFFSSRLSASPVLGVGFCLTVAASLAQGASTFTFNSSIDIPDVAIGNPYPAQLSVSGLGNNLTALTVSLNNFGHSAVSDIGIVLQSPAGQNVMLLGNAGFIIGGSVSITFDDAAPGQVAGQISNGSSYQPTDFTGGGVNFSDAGAHAEPTTWTTTLSSFYGSNPNGTWKLFVQDFIGGDTGSIGSWSISATAVPEPRTYAMVVGGALGGFALLRRRRSRR